MNVRRHKKKAFGLTKPERGCLGHARKMARIIALCRRGLSDAQIVDRLSQVRGFRPPIPPPRKVYEMIAEARSMLKSSGVVAVATKGRNGVRGSHSMRALKV